MKGVKSVSRLIFFACRCPVVQYVYLELRNAHFMDFIGFTMQPIAQKIMEHTHCCLIGNTRNEGNFGSYNIGNLSPLADEVSILWKKEEESEMTSGLCLCTMFVFIREKRGWKFQFQPR